MPGPVLGSGPAWEGPPTSLMDIDRRLYDYLLMIHVRMFGTAGSATGDLDSVNVVNASSQTHAGLTSVTSYQHHGAGSHSALDKATASADASASAVSVTSTSANSTTSPDATDLATVITLANELKSDVNVIVTLANEMKGDVNQVVTDMNAIVTSLNGLKAVMRTAGLLTT